MKTKVETPLDDELRPEYDVIVLKDGVRGKYVAKRAKARRSAFTEYMVAVQ